MSNQLDWIEAELQSLEQANLLRYPKTRESPPVSGMVQIDGRQFINFGSNDYLGIAACQELVLAVQNVIGQIGFGTGASALVNGRGTLHRRLEAELAEFEQTASAMLFPTGYAANVGTICSLVGKQDVVYSDSLNHASIIDGCRLSGAEIVVFPHSDIDHLKEILASSSTYRRRLIVTDGLFSMDGDVAKLPEICSLADEYDAMLMVDEAHATGVLGKHGRGACELLQVEKRVDVKVGTLSKAFGSIGGFVAGTNTLIDWIFNKARPLIYSTAQPELAAAASLAALTIIKEQPKRRDELACKAAYLRDQLHSLGFSCSNSVSQIIPIVLGDSAKTIAAQDELKQQGFFVPAIRPPSVPNGAARLRVSLASSHTSTQIDGLAECLKTLKKQGFPTLI